jgi:hypothetical protein
MLEDVKGFNGTLGMYGDLISSNLLKKNTMFGASHQDSCFLGTPGTNMLLAASPSLVVDPTEFDLMCNLQNATSIGHKLLCNIYVQSMDIVTYFFYVTSPR